MGLDPGYRMGCKVAVVDGTGKVLDTAVVYPTHGERQKAEAGRKNWSHWSVCAIKKGTGLELRTIYIVVI